MSYFISYDSLTREPVSIVWKHDGLFSFIPFDINNIDYQKYVAWVGEGNTAPVWEPSEHDLPIVTPNTI